MFFSFTQTKLSAYKKMEYTYTDICPIQTFITLGIKHTLTQKYDCRKEIYAYQFD